MRQGYLGGTFDPPHLGHLSLAQEALEKFSLEGICFVPSRIPPHKGNQAITPWEHRLEMLRLAIEGNPGFRIADLEPVNSVSYTVNMLEKLTENGEKPYFIIGMDSLVDMHAWKDPFRIARIADVLVGTRPGYRASEAHSQLLEKVTLFSFPGVSVSSSDVRDRISSGRSIRYLVPDSVESYIRSRGLYGTEKGH